MATWCSWKLGVVSAVLLCLLSGSALAETGVGPITRLIERLSFALRGRRLDAAERTTFQRELTDAADRRQLYEKYVDRWLDVRAVAAQVVRSMIRPGFTAASMFIPLRSWGSGGEAILYLPHAVGHEVSEATPPCDAEHVLTVTPWWASAKRVRICEHSYRPDDNFDAVGYCGGQPEPTVPAPPRPTCGCGPLLLTCFPPETEAPGLERRLIRDVYEEVKSAAVDLIANHRPYDELLTTNRSWQSGLIEFLYLRRELLGVVRDKKRGVSVDAVLLDRLKHLDLAAPARWVSRAGLYANSGLFSNTPLVQGTDPTYRVMYKNLSITFMCVRFFGINVDSDVLLRAVGDQHAQLRALGGMRDSPMIRQPGCQGCHAPLDNGAAFYEPLSSPLFGAIPTQRSGSSELFVKGAKDLRGRGEGYVALSRLVVKQPEFAECAVRRAFASATGSAAPDSLIPELVRGFEAHGRDAMWVYRQGLLSEDFVGSALR